VIRLAARFAGAADKIPGFSRRNREFHRFSPHHRRVAAKTVRQIKHLPANSRSSPNREFKPAEPGIKWKTIRASCDSQAPKDK
jgi:hypothetical protein